MDTPIRKYQKQKDYQRHKLFRKMKRRRKAAIEQAKDAPMKPLRRKFKMPKFEGGKDESTQKMNRPNIYRYSDGRYVYQAAPDAEEIEVSPINTLLPNPSQWTYQDASGKIYTPHAAQVDTGSIIQDEERNPLVRAANNYFREAAYRAKDGTLALQGKYTMPAIAASALLPVAGEAAYPLLTNPYVDAAATSAFAGHGLNHAINEGVNGWGDAAMTALEVAPLGRLATPLYKSTYNIINSAYNRLPWTYRIPENPNMAYRRMGPLERDWIMEGNELGTRDINPATELEREAAVAAEKAKNPNRRFVLFKDGAEHGGRKQFAKGQPWKETTVTHGEEQVLAIPGEGLPWVSGRHFQGPQGTGFGVGDISFEEAPFGSHIDLLTEEGYTGVNPSLLDGSVIYSPYKIFGHNFGYKKLYPKNTTPQITAENAASEIPNIVRTVEDSGKIRLSLPSHTKDKPRQFVLEPQGNNKFYVHMRTWDGDHVPANLTNGEKQQLFDALYNELPEGAEILFPKSGPGYYGTRGTVAGLQRLARDSRFTPGTKGTLQYLDKDGKTVRTYEGTSFIKTPRITAENAANITPEQWTAAQDAAIARGDMAEAQRLRDLHFKVNAPNTKTDVPLWTSSEEAFNSFDLSHFGETDSGFFGYGHYLTPLEKYAASYHPVNRKFYVNMENPYIGSNDQYFNRIQYVKDRLALRKENVMRNLHDGKLTKFSKKLGINENTSLEDAERLVDKYIADETVKWNDKYVKYADEFEGKDGVLSWRELQGVPNNQEGIYREVVVPRGEQIKSADAVTYDDNGVRIPLGLRDNFNINDIRYGLLAPLAGGTALLGYNSLGQPIDTYKHGKDSGIHINPKNRGKFNALKKRTGKTTEQLTHSKNPLTRKRAIFAQNAKKFKH